MRKRNTLFLHACGSKNDLPSSIPAAITGLPVLPHFLTRSQLLNRLEPLPVGRDIATITDRRRVGKKGTAGYTGELWELN